MCDKNSPVPEHKGKTQVGNKTVIYTPIKKGEKREKLGVSKIYICADCRFAWHELWLSPSPK